MARLIARLLMHPIRLCLATLRIWFIRFLGRDMVLSNTGERTRPWQETSGRVADYSRNPGFRPKTFRWFPATLPDRVAGLRRNLSNQGVAFYSRNGGRIGLENAISRTNKYPLKRFISTPMIRFVMEIPSFEIPFAMVILSAVKDLLHSSSKCNDIARKKESCNTTNLLIRPRKGIHR